MKFDGRWIDNLYNILITTNQFISSVSIIRIISNTKGNWFVAILIIDDALTIYKTMICSKSDCFIGNINTTTKTQWSAIKFNFTESNTNDRFQYTTFTVSASKSDWFYVINIKLLRIYKNFLNRSNNSWFNISGASCTSANSNIRWINYIIISTTIQNFKLFNWSIINFISTIGTTNFNTVNQYTNVSKISLRFLDTC